MSNNQLVYNTDTNANKQHVSLHDVLFILKNGKKSYPPSIADLPKQDRGRKWDSLLKFSRSFEYDAKTDTLYHIGAVKRRDPKNPRRAKVLFSREKIELILSQVHGSGRIGLHLGAKRTQAMISERFYWRTITKDVKDWIAACPDCKKSAKSKQLPSDTPPLFAHAPWEVIGLSIFGPLPPSSLGYKYVCTATCHFSKWVEAEPMLDKSSESIFAALNKWIHRWGSPTCVIVDQGKEFNVESLNEQLYWHHGVRSLVSYHPAAGGLTERSTSFVKRHLAKVMSNGQTDWHLHIEQACWGLRATFSQATGHSPFEIMTGRKPKFACEIEVEGEGEPLQMVLQEPTANDVGMYIQQKEEDRSKIEKDLIIHYHSPQNESYNPY